MVEPGTVLALGVAFALGWAVGCWRQHAKVHAHYDGAMRRKEAEMEDRYRAYADRVVANNRTGVAVLQGIVDHPILSEHLRDQVRAEIEAAERFAAEHEEAGRG